MRFDFDRAGNPFLLPTDGRIGARDAAPHCQDGVLRRRQACQGKRIREVAMAVMVCAGLTAAWSSEPAPYGHPDFYPSPERPVGWRGNGTGAWPGARPVTNWNADTGQNVVWRSPMPAPSFAQPLVVGERVFTMADPHILLCVNAHSGAILWQTEVDHTAVMEPDKREKARSERRFIFDTRREFGKWCEAQLAFEQKLKEKKITVEAIKIVLDMAGDKDGGIDTSLVGESAAIDAAIKAEYLALTKQKREKGFGDTGGYRCGMTPEKDSPLAKRFAEANREFDLYVTDGWAEPWTTLTFATPCSDGSNVYVTTMNNAVAAVGLDGKIRWLVWDRLEERSKGLVNQYGSPGIGTRFCPSPLLADGKLVVNQNGEIRAYTAATGKKLWGIYNPHKCTFQFPWRPPPEATSPAWTRLALPEGGSMAVVADGGGLLVTEGTFSGFLFRLDDGAIVGRGMGGTWSQTPIFDGDLYMWRRSGPAVADPRGAQRLKAVSRDKVEIENVWSLERSGAGGGGSDAYHDGRLFLINQVFDSRTGDVRVLHPSLPTGKQEQRVDTGCPSPIVAGGHEYCFGRGGDAWVFDVRGGSVITIRPAYKDNRVNEEQEWLWRHAWCGNQQNSSPCVQANRIFWRSKGYLWCFGDPAVPFPAPKDCPPEATVKP
jgi:outer membrane protein assembly factor BamB